jgi:hypothetical protein
MYARCACVGGQSKLSTPKYDLPLLGELSKTFHKTLIPDLKSGADALGRARLGGLAEQSKNLLGKRIAGCKFGRIGREFQIGSRFGIHQFQRQGTNARGGAVFGGKHQLAMMPA